MDLINQPERFDELPEERKEILLKWISYNLLPIRSFNTHYTSYSIKQWIEDDYFTNGEFKGAMLAAGYKVQDKTKDNWVFNISQRSPIIMKLKFKGEL